MKPAMPNNPRPARQQASTSFLLLLAAGLFIFIQAFSLLAPIILSLLLILLVSLAVNPVISLLRDWTGGRRGATALVAAGVVGVMLLTGWAFFGPMRTSVTKFSERLPEYWERLQKPLIMLEQKAVRSEEKLQAEVSVEIAQEATAAGEPPPSRTPAVPPAPQPKTEPGSLRSGLSQAFQGLAGSFRAVTFNAAQMLVVLVTVFFGVVFTLMNPRPVFGALFSLVPERHHGRALTIMQRIGKFVPNWVGATLLGMLTIGLLVFLLMWPIFGFMDALVLGLIAGVLEAVPFLGPLLSFVPALLFAVTKGGMTPLWVVLAYCAVQALESNVILPLIMSRSMKLHPLALIFSMLLCVAAFGVLGVLVAAPLVAIVAILHDELYRKRFLPTATDADLDRLARKALHEKVSEAK
ncbi:MAG: AI-2E family transporter [Deferrisomatales bacterium]|nr:AI-2E family transporter [Deferrisomatales bacterium]